MPSSPGTQGSSSAMAEHQNSLSARPFEDQHFPVAYWARRWGFAPKTVREWFRDEYGPGILRQVSAGRRRRRDYTTLMISALAAARVYAKRSVRKVIH